MGRPVNMERRQRLLRSAVDYAIDNGMSGLSLRPLAAALETDPPVLLHHFGSKEKLIVAILNGVRDRLRQISAETTAGGGRDRLTAIWTWASDPRHEKLYRLFFEAYGVALQRPEQYREFLDHVVDDWLEELGQAVGPERVTLVLAALRGLLLDLLATGDRDRVNNAARLLASLVQLREG